MDLNLRTWPNITDCVACSSDCELAVAADEYVEILTPKLKPTNITYGAGAPSFWDILHLRTNIYTEAEVPLHLPFGNPIASIGEEQSQGHVTKLEWSQPGLSKYRRCALAVLTSNHVLSLWVSHGQPRQLKSWSRRLILNHALKRFYAQDDSSPNDEKSEMERITRASRIRGFCWDRRVDSDRYLIAVSTDAAEIILICIQPAPFVSRGPQEDFQVDVVASFPVADQEPKLPNLSWTVEDYIQNRPYAQHIVWSPWFEDESGKQISILAYATNGKLEMRSVSGAAEQALQLEVSSPIFIKRIDPLWDDLTGPVKWYPRVFEDQNVRKIVLAVASSQRVAIFKINIWNLSSVSEDSFNREQWDEVAALAFTAPVKGPPNISIVNHLSSLTSTDVEKTLGLPKIEPTTGPTVWQQYILQRATTFSARWKLAMNVNSRVWGMVSGPIGDWLASISSQHPSDMPEYRIQSDYSCNVAVHKLDAHAGSNGLALPGGGGLLRPRDISSEAIAFSMKHLLTTSGDAGSKRLLHDEDDCVDNVIECAVDKDDQAPYENGSSSIAGLDFGLDSAISRKGQLTALVHMQLKGSSDAPQDKYRITAFARSAIQVSENFSTTDKLSADILLALEAAAFLSEVTDADITTADPFLGMPTAFEQCEICDAPISFRDLRQARCDAGHQFARCALTFLSVQAPGISKFCAICGKQFLSDRFLIARGGSDETHLNNASNSQNSDVDMLDADLGERLHVASQASNTFAKHMFASVQVCIYCGGKFMD